MNAYIYEGRTRIEVTRSLKEEDERAAQLSVGDSFAVNALDSGLILIFNNPDYSSNEFGFEYWVDATKKPEPEPEPVEEEKEEPEEEEETEPVEEEEQPDEEV